MLPKDAFAIPEKRKYPIHDISHARNALARVSGFGSEWEKQRERVRAAVYDRYPQLRPPPVTVSMENLKSTKRLRHNRPTVMIRQRIPLRIRRILGMRPTH